MIIIYCGKHPEYKGTQGPVTQCSTCTLLHVLVCRDDKHVTGAPDIDTHFKTLTQTDLEEACRNLETSRTGTL